MRDIAFYVERYALLIVFMNALLEEGGLPFPVFPMLMTAGALATQSRYQIVAIIFAAVSGFLIADLAWYWVGKRHGPRVMRLLCKVSLSPDFCIRRTETVYVKVGLWALLLAKFLPELSPISAAMAGASKIPLPRFLLFVVIGAVLFVSMAVEAGRIFRDEVTYILIVLTNVGKFGVLFVLALFGSYLMARWWRRRVFMRQLLREPGHPRRASSVDDHQDQIKAMTCAHNCKTST
jgi:membrane protein DedA with SNARE-associated domain